MKKSLLLGLMTCMSLSSFAFEAGDYVETPQGAFKIVGTNKYTGSFAGSVQGWEVISANPEKTMEGTFTTNVDEAGFQYAQAVETLATEGMSYAITGIDPNANYVVSFKLMNAAETAPSTPITMRTAINTNAGTNYVNIVGNDGAEDVTYGKAMEIGTEWVTYSFAITGDGVDRNYKIILQDMNANVRIADVEIFEAEKAVDLRERDNAVAALTPFLQFRGMKGVNNDFLDDLEYYLGELETADTDSDVDTFEENLAGAYKTVNGEGEEPGLAGSLTAFFSGETTFPAGSKRSSLTKIGDWSVVVDGGVTNRGYRSANDYYDIGHYARSNTSNHYGVTMTKSLEAGKYVFSIDTRAHARISPMSNNDDWAVDEGLKIRDAVVFVLNAEGDTVATTGYFTELPMDYQNSTLAFTVPAKGDYTIAVDCWRKDGYANNLGGALFVKNAQMYGLLAGDYTQDEKDYVGDVQEQIATATNKLTEGQEKYANPDIKWGKAEMMAEFDAYKELYDQYVAIEKDTATILDRYDKATYNRDNRTKTAEEGLMVFEVYDNLTKYYIAAVRALDAKNDTLNSLAAAIADAKAAYALRTYDSSTKKADLAAEIKKAEELNAEMIAGEYTHENAQAIVEENNALAQAVTDFKNALPAEAVTTLVDIDFETKAQDVEGQYVISGNKGSMTLSVYNTEDAEANDREAYGFYQGHISGGETILPGLLRVGKGEGVVELPAVELSTNIIRLTFDYYFARLTKNNASPGGTYCGFYIKDAEANNIATLYYSPYWAAVSEEANNTFGLNLSGTYLPSIGKSGQENDVIAGSGNVTHFEVVLDYGTKKMYCTTTTSKGVTQTSEMKDIVGDIASFVVTSSHENKGRRCWFDNLKIEKILAGEPDAVNGVAEVNAAAPAAVKFVKNGTVLIKTANGTVNAAGAQVK